MGEGFCIGKVKIENPVISAPMAGVSDQSYRILAKEAGCGLVYTEMVSDQALLYSNPKTLALLGTGEEKSPISVQIFGSNPEYLAKAATIVEEKGADIIDLNMGCPTPKIVKNGEGSALLKNPELIAKIIDEVKRAVLVPLTVKMRIGWDKESINVVEIAKLLEEKGVSAIAVHGRTREQYYAGEASWEAISKVQEAVSIPVIANGDVRSDLDAKAILEKTNCKGVMVGRASMGNPWIFNQILHYLKTKERISLPTPQEKIEMALRHLELLVEFKGGVVGIWEMRKHASWYTKGIKGAASLRNKINQASTKEEMENLLRSLLN